MDLKEKLKECKEFGNVVELDLNNPRLFVFDLTLENEELNNVDLSSTEEFSKYIFKKLEESGFSAGIGRYNENRTIYSRSPLFNGLAEEDKRTIHLGIDIWARPGTKVYTPFEAVVHSFKDNNTFGDYGPTIILKHNIDGFVFHTLYGHLSRPSLDGLVIGRTIAKGSEIARIGNYPTNGNWPPHLHFQIVEDLLGMNGDFYGVTSSKEKEFYLRNSPDPNLILRIRKLSSGV